MKITWADAGYPDKPGNIPLLDGMLVIEQKQIDNWAVNPDAIYEVNLDGSFGSVKKYTLGSWEHKTGRKLFRERAEKLREEMTKRRLQHSPIDWPSGTSRDQTEG